MRPSCTYQTSSIKRLQESARRARITATLEQGEGIPYNGNLLQEEIFANPAILLSEEIFAIFDFNLLGDFRD